MPLKPIRPHWTAKLLINCLPLWAAATLLATSQAYAGDVIAFPGKAKEIACRIAHSAAGTKAGAIEGKNVISELTSPLATKLQKLAEYENFQTETVHQYDAKMNGTVPRNQVIELSKRLKADIAREIRSDSATSSDSLLRLLNQPSASGRKQAAEMLALLPLSDEQFSQFQKSILNLYGRMEIISLNPKDEGKAKLGDPGENSKVFQEEIKTFSKMVKNANPQRFQDGLSFLSQILERLTVDGPATKDPAHMDTLVRTAISELAVTEDATQFTAVDKMLTELGRRHPRKAASLIVDFDSAREKAFLHPDGLKDLSLEVYNQLANQFEKITQTSGRIGRELEDLRDSFSNILLSMLNKGLINESSPQAPLPQVKSIVTRFLNMKREFRFKDKLLVHSYVLVISKFGKKLTAEEEYVMFTLTEKLFADAQKAPLPEDDEAAVIFGKDTLLKDTVIVMDDLVATHRPEDRALFFQIATSPHVNNSTRSQASRYLK